MYGGVNLLTAIGSLFMAESVVDIFQEVLLQYSNKVQRDSCVQVIDIINANRKFEVTTGKQSKNQVCFLWTLHRDYKKGKSNKDQVKYLIYTCIFNIHLTIPHS